MRRVYLEGMSMLVFMAVPSLFLGGVFWLIERPGNPSWPMFVGGALGGLAMYLYATVYLPRKYREPQ